MTIDEFIWLSPFKLQSHDTHTYALFDEFICSSPGALKYTRCNQKLTIIFKFRELHMFDFRIIVNNISHFGLLAWFFTDEKVSCVLVCSSIFYY